MPLEGLIPQLSGFSHPELSQGSFPKWASDNLRHNCGGETFRRVFQPRQSNMQAPTFPEMVSSDETSETPMHLNILKKILMQADNKL